jgi:UDPglucose 6-dehydrogenase
MKKVVVGMGYVGLSNAMLLAQHNNVIGVDILMLYFTQQTEM